MEKHVRPRVAISGAAVALVFALSGARPSPAPVTAGAATDHVVVVSMDGLRPDAIERYGAKTLLRLKREGTYAPTARTIFPSKTLPSHTSMLTGEPPEVHGITWNDDQVERAGVVSVPTVFELAKQAGFTTAAFFSKSKFHHLQKSGTLDYTQAPNGSDRWLATRTVSDVVTYLKHERPNLLFVHLADADLAGHGMGWMSFIYGWAVDRLDGAVEKIVRAADDAYGANNYTLIVTADHGGHDRNHGSRDDSDMFIPWIVWGKGVTQGGELAAEVRTMDTAATVAWLLGAAGSPSWAGVPVATAFAADARHAAELVYTRHAGAVN